MCHVLQTYGEGFAQLATIALCGHDHPGPNPGPSPVPSTCTVQKKSPITNTPSHQPTTILSYFQFSKNNRNTMETQLKPASEHVRV